MTNTPLLDEALTGAIIGAYYEVYNTLGFGFLEHVYSAALERELVARGRRVSREFKVPVFYKGEQVAAQRLDMVVDGKIVVEIKALERLPKVATHQLYNYLRGTDLEIGLLFNFGLKPEFHRLVCTRKPNRPPPKD